MSINNYQHSVYQLSHNGHASIVIGFGCRVGINYIHIYQKESKLYFLSTVNDTAWGTIMSGHFEMPN